MIVQIVRFKDGLDIITEIDYSDESVELSNPMMFSIKNGNLMLQHWLPLAVIKSDTVTVDKSEILCVMDPNDDFCEYYSTTVSKMKDILSPSEKKSENIMEELKDVVEAMAEMETTRDLKLH
jgi:hypothetical protein